MRMPPSPPLSQPPLPGLLCNETTVINCKQIECACPYTLTIPLGSLVEIILIDEGVIYRAYSKIYSTKPHSEYLKNNRLGVPFEATHPFHLHGSSFRVVGMERISTQVSIDQIKTMEKNGLLRRNLVDAPIKDTVAVPDGGYTIIRFMAVNPGIRLKV